MAKAKLKTAKAKSKQHIVPRSVLDEGMRCEPSEAHFIRHWRLYKQVKTQQDLAVLTMKVDPKGVGLERVTICRLETGLTRYNEWHLDLIGKALGVTPVQLIGTDPFKQPAIIDIYARLSPEKKRKLEKLALSLQD